MREMRKLSRYTVTGLDIGSSKVCAVMAELSGDGEFHALAAASTKSRGIERGNVVDLSEAVNSISKTLGRLRDKANRRPDNLYVNLSGLDVKARESKGVIPLSLRGREVTAGDITRCVNVASTMKLPLEREIIYKMIKSFYIDDQIEVKDPLGLYGSRLSVTIYAITTNANKIQNIMKCVNNAGYDLREFVFSAIADSHSLLESYDKERGVALIDIGDSLTELVVFQEGVLRSMGVLPLGARDMVTHDKREAAFNKIKLFLLEGADRFQNGDSPIREVVLTGGFSLSDKIMDIEKHIRLPVRIGTVKGVKGNISSSESVAAITSIGLAKYALEKSSSRFSAKGQGLLKRLATKVVDIFNNYF